MKTTPRRLTALLGLTSAILALTVPTAAADDEPTPREIIEACDAADRCIFHVRGRQTFPGETHRVGGFAYNCASRAQSQSLSWSDMTGHTNTVGVIVRMGMKFAKTLEAGVENGYQHSWMWTHTETRTDSLWIGPFRAGWIEHAPTMQRVDGTYELHFKRKWRGHHIWYQEFSATAPLADAQDSVTFHDRWISSKEMRDVCRRPGRR